MTTQTGAWKLEQCPALITIKLISGKWKTRILWQLRSGPMQFGELRRALKGISAKMLTEHLRQLEDDGLIFHEISTRGGLQISNYSYTNYGETLIPVLDLVGNWGVSHESKSKAATKKRNSGR